MHKALIAVLLAASATAAQAVTITFNTPGNTNPGNTASFGPLTATGYTCTSGCTGAGILTDLFIKADGAGEEGLGLNLDPTGQHEIFAPPPGQQFSFVQLDVSAILALTAGATFTMDSSTNGELWRVFGSNTAGRFDGTSLQTNFGTDELSHAFGNWGTYKYYDFFSTGSGEVPFGNVLLSSVTYAVPEPGTWAMMLLGFAGIGAAMRRNRKRLLTQLA